VTICYLIALFCFNLITQSNNPGLNYHHCYTANCQLCVRCLVSPVEEVSIISFSDQQISETCTNSSQRSRPHPCMADPILHSTHQQFIYLGVAPSTQLTYQSGMSSFHNFCSIDGIPSSPASTLTVQFFCAYSASRVSYKTIKVYLAGIRLTHLEQGHPDPTNSESLPLLIRRIRRHQGESSRNRLPITISVLHTA